MVRWSYCDNTIKNVEYKLLIENYLMSWIQGTMTTYSTPFLSQNSYFKSSSFCIDSKNGNHSVTMFTNVHEKKDSNSNALFPLKTERNARLWYFLNILLFIKESWKEHGIMLLPLIYIVIRVEERRLYAIERI